jgi:nitroreductase
MNTNKLAQTDHAVNELISRRWSPYAYSNRAVAKEDLMALFEAARWAASSYNEQPWRYIVATRETPAEEYENLLSCLVEANQGWAQGAPVLALGVAGLKYAKNGTPNRHALHDLGQASANLCVEATARGLAVHQMGGIVPAKAREIYGIPEDFDVVTGLAIGYAAEGDEVPEPLREGASQPRPRKPLTEILFSGRWGQSAK